MTDVRLYESGDDGNIEFVNGQAVMSNGLETASYLSMFGGNEQDSGTQADTLKQFWGNLSETDPTRQYRSETQALIQALPLVPANLRRIEEAATRDHNWMLSTGLANGVAIVATMPALNTVQLDVNIEINGQVFSFSFTEKSAVT